MKRFIKNSVSFTLLLILGFSLLQFLGLGGGAVELDFSDHYLIIEGPDDYQIKVFYKDIEKISLVEPDGTATVVSGGTKKGVTYGARLSEELGEYELCADEDAAKCIALFTKNGLRLFSYESDETTEKLIEALPALLKEKGY